MQELSTIEQGIEHGISTLSGRHTPPGLALASRATHRVRIRIGARGCGGGAKAMLPGVYERDVAKSIIAALVDRGLARPVTMWHAPAHQLGK